MKNLFQRNRGVIQILGTLGFIFTLLLYYYGVYIPANEKYVLEQNFRLLRNTGSGLTEKVTAFKNLANSYASSYYYRDTIIKQLKGKQIFEDCELTNSLQKKETQFLIPDNTFGIDKNDSVRFLGIDDKADSANHFIGKISANKFLNPILSNQAFEGFFLVSKSRIIYDGTHLGLSKDNFIKNSGLEKKLYQSCDTQVEINGTRYRAFAMPLDLHNEDGQVTIGGFVEEKNIQNQIKMVRPYILITLFFILTLAMLLLPFFKIWVLGKKDKLNLSDVSAVYITAYMLVAVLSLWFLYSGQGIFLKDKDKAMHADILITAVQNSILEEMDLAKDIIQFCSAKDSIELNCGLYPFKIKHFFLVDTYGSIIELLHMGSTGILKKSTFIPKTNLSDRSYFKKINDDFNGVAIEPILSRTDNKFEIVFARKSKPGIEKGALLAGLSIIPTTFSNSILPKGTQMALIDKHGKVIMHSEPTKNMRENLIDELQYGQELQTTLKLGVPSLFNSRYFDKLCEIHAIPLKGYPDFFLVSINDVSYCQQYKMDALLVTSSFLLAILLFVFLISFLVYKYITKGSIRKNGSLYLNWIYPKPDKRDLYELMSYGAMVVLLLFLLFFVFSPCYASGLYMFLVIWGVFAIPLFLVPIFSRNVIAIIKKFIGRLPFFKKRADTKDARSGKFFPDATSYVRWYSFLIFIKLCYFSLLPACFIYLSSQDYFFQKFKQNLLYDFAKSWMERDGKPNLKQVNHSVFGGPIAISPECSQIPPGENRSNAVYDFLEPDHSSATDFGFLTFDGQSENDFKMRNIPDSIHPKLFLPDLSFDARLENPHFPNVKSPGRWFWFYFLFFAGLGFIFLLVHHIIKKIFGVKTPDYLPFLNDARARLKYFLDVENCKTNYIFLQGVTSSFKIKLLQEILEDPINGSNGKYYSIDMLNIPDKVEFDDLALKAKWEKHIKPIFSSQSKIEVLVLKHFEYNYEDPHTNHIKLNLMERISQKKDWKIVITSAIDPTGLLEALEIVGNINDNQKKILADDIGRWKVLLGKFVNIMVSVHTSGDEKNKTSFNYEMESNEFLKGFKALYAAPEYAELANKNYDGNHDELLIDLHTVTTHFYRDVWNSLMPEEKVMMYDLAEEGLLNTTNYLTLFGLIRKGLIVKNNGVYFVMNQSFRHFILSSVSESEMQKAENRIDEKSIWKDYQGPILVLIAALLWFILYANQDQFGQIFPIITALATGIPTLIKLFSYFIPGAAKG